MTRQRAVGDARVRGVSVPDTMRLGGALLVPWPPRNLVPSRSRAAALAARLGADRRAVRLLTGLRRRYGPGPLRVALPGRRMMLLLSPGDVHRVLADVDGAFAPPAAGDGGAPARFQPHGVPDAPGTDRKERRRADEAVLDTHQKVHRFGGTFMVSVHQEAAGLLAAIPATGELGWDDFADAHWRLIRRIVLGDAARDDRMLTDLLLRLTEGRDRRGRGRAAAHDTFRRRLRMYVERAEPDSLAGLLARAPAAPGADPLGEVTRWLTAFGAAGTVTYRALALLGSHPDRLARARAEIGGLPGEGLPSPVSVPYLRACVQESARLWPVTRVIVRRSVTATGWHGRTVPAGTVFLVVVPFFNRDRAVLRYADRFSPDAWLDGRAAADGAIVPFGGGAGGCAGANLALLTATTFLAALLRGHEPRLIVPRLNPRRPLPHGLDHFSARLALRPAVADGR